MAAHNFDTLLLKWNDKNIFPCLSPTIFLSFYILPLVHLSPIQPSVHPSSHRPVTWSQVIGLRQFGLQLSLHMIPKNPAGHSIRREQFYFQKQELFLIKEESTKNILSNVCIFVPCVIVHIKINIFSMYAWRHCKYCFKKNIILSLSLHTGPVHPDAHPFGQLPLTWLHALFP